jgi:hypothetical protein
MVPVSAAAASGQSAPVSGPRKAGQAWSAVCGCAAVLLTVAAAGPSPLSPQGWQANLTVTSGAASRQLVFGQHSEATMGLDALLGEVELPPLPPSGSYDVRFVGQGLGNGSAVDLRPLDFVRTDTLVVSIQWLSSPARSLQWDAQQIAARASLASLTDSRGGQLGVNVDMRAVSEVVITNLRVERLWLVIRSADAADDTSAVAWRTWGQLKGQVP